MDERKQKEPSPSEQDVYVVGWGFAGGIATIALCKLIGAVAIGIAVVLAAIAAWKLKRAARRLSRRGWWACWIVLLLVGVGLATFEAQTMSVPAPVLGPDGQLH